MNRRFVPAALCLSLALSPFIAPLFAADLATVHLGQNGIDWQPTADAAAWVLTVTGPEGFHHREEFADAPSMDLFTADGQFLADGLYNYELRAIPRIDAQLRQELDATAGNLEQRERLAARVRDLGGAQSGHFRIHQGSLVTAERAEVGPETMSDATSAEVPTMELDQVFSDDVIVDGSLCVGFDCIDGENFGFDTIKLKENNLRIFFDDTSSTSFFPNNDWRLVANDFVNGGANRFSIEDATATRDVFTIEAGAPASSLYVDSTGHVGLGTSTPVFEVHLVNGDTPTLRLEQDASIGFTPQTWDIGANEGSFFVRDATNGATRPLKIQPGAPTDSLVIESTGTVSLASPLPISEGGTGATNAADARANLGIEADATKAGILPASAFSGTPATATVTFAEPFPPSTSIVVMLTTVTSDSGKTIDVSLLSTTVNGFTVTRGQAGGGSGGGGGGGGAGGGPSGGSPAGGGDPLVEVHWLARPVGE